MIVLTNNPLVKEKLSNFNVLYLDCSYGDVLSFSKQLIIDNRYQLLSHPLSGSIKPNETYYKSILIDESKSNEIDIISLEYLESALDVYEKFIKDKQRPNWTKKILNDFATIDFYLIEGAIDCANLK